jgi:hypothetical protein
MRGHPQRQVLAFRAGAILLVALSIRGVLGVTIDIVHMLQDTVNAGTPGPSGYLAEAATRVTWDWMRDVVVLRAPALLGLIAGLLSLCASPTFILRCIQRATAGVSS